ncbi:MAG: NUDIX hydrolase YfcD [Desulfobulbus sp.]|uniref:NUDIX hydrolase YfcD n=1 Tax=Desulfobulbus sp. TaxID=895 RepID=UPI0028419292|nr:NUDIX hydrolase YfcD [Desulfobulbus sp.]MDR2550078.1 NUDIX hydrolase YfcD [Desulfobulbus sp.]
MFTHPAEELVEIVDQDNNPIGAVTRRIMRQQNLIHRASYVLVFNREGQLFIQKRTLTKDIYPGYWDLAAGGVVQAGEPYLESAQRELREELGLAGVKLAHLFDQYFEEDGNRVWGRIFSCVSEGPFILQEEEIDYGRFIDLDQIEVLNRTEPVTPDGLALLRLLPRNRRG